MNKKFVILGANGQVGRACSALLGAKALAFSRVEVNLESSHFLGDMEKLIGNTPIAAVINAAAYTDVRKAEAEEALATRVNGEAVGELSAWCGSRGTALVHFSTDYVFGDDKSHFHTETEPARPLNAYGRSKLAGERLVEKNGGKYLIFRTSWVYDATGRNFFNTMLRLFQENEQMTVAADQMGAPTYAPDLARLSYEALDKALAAPEFPSGIYHLCNSGETSWHGFAQAIFTLARSRDSGIRCQQVNPISTRERNDPVQRPLNSRLDCSKVQKKFGISIPEWKDGLQQCIEEKYEN